MIIISCIHRNHLGNFLVKNIHVINLIFVGQEYPRKLINPENYLNYSNVYLLEVVITYEPNME